MKIKHLVLALLFFLFPVVLRTVWFYKGISLNNNTIQTPDFESFQVNQPTLSMPDLNNSDFKENRKTILFDQAHRNQFSLGEIESLRDQLLWRGAEILTLKGESELRKLLKKSDVFITIAPTEFFSEAEVELIEEFVNRGGRLLVMADPTRSITDYPVAREESVMIANEILAPYQISFRNDYVYNLAENEGNFRNVIVNPSENNFLSKNISEIVLYAAHSLTASTESLLTSSENTLSSLDDSSFAVSLAATDASQNVLAIGDMTFLVTPYNQVMDNYQLLFNIVDFLYDGTREKNLDNFPYLFVQDIGLILHDDIDLDENLLNEVADLKSLFSMDDIDLAIMKETADGNDFIHLGIYPPGEELRTYTDQFGIQFTPSDKTAAPSPTPTRISETADNNDQRQDENGDELPNGNGTRVSGYFQIPGFGEVPDSGFGYILLFKENESMHLIFLADSQENIINLLSLMSSGSLSGCLVHNDIAVCEQDARAEEEPTQQPEELNELLPEEEIEELAPTPTDIPTATPVPTSVPGPD